jgi:eukaryotic-like serine/threonine-protein kinase
MSDMSPPEPPRLAPGTRLNGVFEIDRYVAAGRAGEIYRAHAVATGDPAAIKTMRADLAGNALALALFRREASALHGVDHEAIVRYYLFSHDPGTGRHYLAMEFVDGPSLSALMAHRPLGASAVHMLQKRLAAGRGVHDGFPPAHRAV